MAKVPNGVETLPKISIAGIGCTNVTDRQTTDDRQTDGRTDGQHIANVNVTFAKNAAGLDACKSQCITMILCIYFEYVNS